MTDIEIANSVKIKPILKIAEKLGIGKGNIELYGNVKAKINYTDFNPKARLVLVSAINPTPAGEGKTTVTIGLTDALCKIGIKASAALREPSLGPVFGIKGGAAGGGYSQVIPMQDINLHFTGDLHAVSSANNLLAAIIDNHLNSGNELGIHPKKILWKRCVDLNDRALRNIVVGLGSATDGVSRMDGFNITAASEIMAILCLASSLEDAKKRIGNIIVAYNYADEPVYARDLKAEDAMTILLKDALKPNLVQTLEGNPAFVHGGPFANIAHGCNSVMATKLAMTFSDYVVTEAGFGADLGAEKFLHVKCRENGLAPSCVVVVATVRALKYHGGVKREDLAVVNAAAVEEGVRNLEKHVENMTSKFGLNVVVAINRFSSDSEDELLVIKDSCRKMGVKAVVADVFAKGGEGGTELAREVFGICEKSAMLSDGYIGVNEDSNKDCGEINSGGQRLGNSIKPTGINFLYKKEDSIENKIGAICREVYGAGGVSFSAKAKSDIAQISKLGFAGLPVIIAKTQYSLSDDAKKLGRPQGFVVNVREVQLRSGSGFVVAVAGDVMLMPGLPKVPASENMRIDGDGKITGLF